jgi:hypothetical protein
VTALSLCGRPLLRVAAPPSIIKCSAVSRRVKRNILLFIPVESPMFHLSSYQSQLPGHYVIWLQIIENLTSQSDLSNVSLCCRQLHHIAALQRWERISIGLSNESLRRLFQLKLAPTRYVRHIELTGDHGDEFSISPILHTLAECVHPGLLRSVTYVE